LTRLAALIAVGPQDADSIRRMASLVTPMALRVAVTLGLPDRLRGAGAGAAVADLAAELGRSPVGLELLLAHLATLGIVERTAAGAHGLVLDTVRELVPEQRCLLEFRLTTPGG
jgi:hypothetical protein